MEIFFGFLLLALSFDYITSAHCEVLDSVLKAPWNKNKVSGKIISKATDEAGSSSIWMKPLIVTHESSF